MQKKTFIIAAATATLMMSGCTEAEVAAMEKGMEDARYNSADMIQMERDCKNYVAEKFLKLPMAAISVRPGYGSNGRYTIPVSINWDNPRVEETGNCIIVNGIVRNYKPNY